MYKKTKHITFLFFTLLIMISASCIKNEICIPANSLMKTEFYTVNDQGDRVKYEMDSLNVFITGRDDTLYYKAKGLDEFLIPLSDSATQLIIVVNLNDGQDTIWLDYRPYSVFRSTECGVINRYEIQNLNFTKHSIWEIGLLNNTIDENKETNLYMFYRTH